MCYIRTVFSKISVFGEQPLIKLNNSSIILKNSEGRNNVRCSFETAIYGSNKTKNLDHYCMEVLQLVSTSTELVPYKFSEEVR